MAYSDSQIAEAVSTVHMNSRRQAKRNETTNYANGDLNLIGNHFFVYSGPVSGNNVQFTVLNFKTGPNYLKGFYRCGYGNSTYRNYDFNLLFNDVEIENQFLITSQAQSNLQFLHEIIIPPFTDVKVLAQNTEDSTTQEVITIFTGKVYSGAEIIQGAI